MVRMPHTLHDAACRPIVMDSKQYYVVTWNGADGQGREPRGPAGHGVDHCIPHAMRGVTGWGKGEVDTNEAAALRRQ